MDECLQAVDFVDISDWRIGILNRLLMPIAISFLIVLSIFATVCDLTAGSLKIDASGGANIDMAVKCEQIVIGMSGGARITAFGETGALKASGSGGAHLEAAGLKANDVTLGGSGAAGLRVWAVQNLSVSSLSGAATVRYKGDPRIGTLQIDRGSFGKLNP